MEPKERKPWGASRIVFLSQVKAIQERLDKGIPLSQIHRELEGELDGMIYSQFTHYVRKHFRQKSRTVSKPVVNQSIKPIVKREKAEPSHFIAPEMAPDMSQYI